MVKCETWDPRVASLGLISMESVVAQWLAHLPLVLEVPGLISACNVENFGVPTRFL